MKQFVSVYLRNLSLPSKTYRFNYYFLPIFWFKGGRYFCWRFTLVPQQPHTLSKFSIRVRNTHNVFAFSANLMMYSIKIFRLILVSTISSLKFFPHNIVILKVLQTHVHSYYWDYYYLLVYFKIKTKKPYSFYIYYTSTQGWT